MNRLVIVCCVMFCAASMNAQGAKDTALVALLENIEKVMTDEGIVGLSLGICTKDSVVFSGGLGWADRENKRLVTNETLFRMGSITKMFVALGILKLAKEGKISLDDELKKVAPEVPFRNEWEDTAPVQIIHLLEQTTGFDDVKLNAMYSLNGMEYSGLDAVLVQKNSLVTRWKPGMYHSYANPNYAILGYLIEKISGLDYKTYLKREILLPLGMEHSNFNVNSRHPNIDTREYYRKGDEVVETPSVTLKSGAVGALWSSAEEMIAFLQLFLNRGDTLLNPSLIAAMEKQESSLAAKSGLSVGYGKGNYLDFGYSKTTFRGHHGRMGNCRSSFFYNREINMGFVLSHNSNVPNHELERLIVGFLEKNYVAPALATPYKKASLDKEMTAKYVGFYEFQNPRNQIAEVKDKLLRVIRIFEKDGELYQQSLFGQPELLQPQSEGVFQHPKDNRPAIAFTELEGQVVLIQHTAYFKKTTAIRAVGGRIFVVVAVLLSLSSVFYVLYSLFGVVKGRVGFRELLVRSLPVMALFLLVFAVLKLLHAQSATFLLHELEVISFTSLAIFIGTLGFGVLTVGSAFYTAVLFRTLSHRYYRGFLHLGLLYVLFLLWNGGWIPLQTWSM